MKLQLLLLCIIATILQCNSLKLGPSVHQLTAPVDHAEGPTWDPRNNILYYVDIHTGTLHSYHYDTDAQYSVKLNGEITPAIPSQSDPSLIIVGLNRSIVAIQWNGMDSTVEAQKTLATVSQQFPTSRFNDGKADKQGRLWFGTMGYEDSSGTRPNEGLLYLATRENLPKPKVAIAPVTVSNGLAWNKNNDKMFYIDSASGKVVEYKYCDETAEITYNRVAFDISRFSNYTGVPDGMTIDKDDNLWVAIYNGGSILQVDPNTGNILQSVALPSKAVTSAIWGGPALDILFVTTSRVNLSAEERNSLPAAGAVFAVTDLGTNGLAVFNADIIDKI